MTMKHLRVLYHDNCFDGLASAAVFSRFYQATVAPDADIEYAGLSHRANQTMDDVAFGPDDNVIVDFKYSASDHLTWWFDHHESAFLSPEDEAHFRRDTSGRKFHDPSFKSCTKYIASETKKKFGFAAADLEELIHWADIIDGAQFPSAQMAVELKEPALRLMMVIEGTHERAMLHKIIRLMQRQTLARTLDEPEVRAAFEALHEKHLASIGLLGERARCDKGVIEFDVSDRNLDGYNKFIPYYLFPQSVYSVGVSRSASRAKVSVGTNPWSPRERIHNLAKLCEHYGGGGHAVVAAISFKPDELENARTAAREIAQKLQRDLAGA
ncbi:MAG TPA: phosphoesterase [Terriglobia bacterium]|nr:phosphoesterase [Terriglobia bacterium]